MTDYNIVCVLCGHTPHSDKQCHDCECKIFIRADVAVSRLLYEIRNEFPKITMLLADLLEIIAETNPQAVEAINQRRATAKAEQEKESDVRIANSSPEFNADNRD